MTVLAEQAAVEGDRAIQSRALTALSEVAASLDGELVRAAELADEALAVVEADDHDGRFRALDRRARVARWAGREAEAEEFLQQALEAARAAAAGGPRSKGRAAAGGDLHRPDGRGQGRAAHRPCARRSPRRVAASSRARAPPSRKAASIACAGSTRKPRAG